MGEHYRASFSFDYGSGCCLWAARDRTRDRYDYAIYNDELRLNPGTVGGLDDLCARIDSSLNWDYPPDPSPWRQVECDRFNADVTATIERLRRELGPGWEIIDEFIPLIEDPDLDRYLADPKGFHRQAANRRQRWRTWGRLLPRRRGKLR